MNLKYLKSLMMHQDGMHRITCMSWAPNNQKLAVATSDRTIILFDETGERKDKFATKPADAKYGKQSYQVKCMAFSPCSSKIAIGQTDNIILVYKIGEEWGDKKTICNKFPQSSAVLALIWPPDRDIVCGLGDGKIRLCNSKTNKSSTLFGTDSMVVSLTCSGTGKTLLSGHADGSIARYFFEEEGGGNQGKIVTHRCPPYALCWTASTIVAGGCDKRVVVYTRDGKQVQQFDYSHDDDEKELTVAASSPSGQSFVVGSWDKLRVYNWSPRRHAWEEAKSKEIKNLYTITSLAWRKDGSRLVAGTLCGAVEMFDCALKRNIIRNKFEVTYVGLSQVIVKTIETGHRVVLKSFYGYEIDEVKVMGQDRFLVAHTSDTLMVGDMQTSRLSEVQWQATGGNEKFFFENPLVCMIFNAGELSLIEYGTNEILGSVRTEFMNPHVISIRLNERKQNGVEDSKKMVYLLDLKTVCILDLTSGITLSTLSHESKIDWLELNETGRKLLFRDKRLRLYLYDIMSETKTTVLNYCTYVQWVPGSDVVVAQNRGNLCVWYNIDVPEQVSMFPIKGDITDVERTDGKTDVIVNEGMSPISYTLDEGLIEFGTAVDDGDYSRAISFLETLEMSSETEAMWKTLSKLSLENSHLLIAERCFAALGDIAKTRYLKQLNEEAITIAEELKMTDGTRHYTIKAKLAMLMKQFKEAERIYIENNCVDDAIAMYQQLHKWDAAIEVAEVKQHPQLDNLRRSYHDWLMDTGQEEKAGELKENEGEINAAIQLYMKAGMPARAARVVSTRDNLLENTDLVQRIAAALIKGEFFERAGDLFEKAKSMQRALECYRRGQAYRRALDLAKTAFPQDVVKLEEEWGDHLVSQKQLDAAINHYIEAGASLKATEAAIQARQWQKAIQILKFQDKSVAAQYYHRIALHYAAIKEYEHAEYYYVQAGMHKEAIDMYKSAGKWEEAHKIAAQTMNPDEVSTMYMVQAEELEKQGKFKEAERLYLIAGDADSAIAMYKREKQYEPMIKLIRDNHPELLQESHLHLAKELEAEKQFRQAEHHFVEAKEWKNAVNMYRLNDLWDEAFRVAKGHGGPNASKQVAYLWAKSLGGESAVKLLNKYGLLESAIDYAAENGAFDFAFELARTAMKEKLPDIHIKQAEFLEDEGKFREAEEEFIKANRPKEAVLMYVHNRDWDSAQRVAELHDKESISDVLIGQARMAFDNKEYQQAESYLLKAFKPEIAVSYYQEAGMFQDAMRICKEYLPNKVDDLQRAFQQSAMEQGIGVEGIVHQAQSFETSGDHIKAVEAYSRISNAITDDTTILEQCWMRAGNIAIKFLDNHKAMSVVNEIAPRLVKIKKYKGAAELYLNVDLVQEAVDVLMAGDEWAKARKVARELDSRLEAYVENKYKEYLKFHGETESLAKVDMGEALDTMAERGEWVKCIETAKSQGAQVLHKYIAKYATNLIKKGNSIDALHLYNEHGSPANNQNFNIYKRIAADFLIMPNSLSAEAQKLWANLRDMLYDLTENIKTGSHSDVTQSDTDIFNALLLVSHYNAIRCSCIGQPQLEPLLAKLSVSLLRYTHLIPADRAFYEAGIHCRAQGWGNMAFVFLNRFLDLCEAIEENSLDGLDNTDFRDTDIPFEIELPEHVNVIEDQREEVREWVLAVSMDHSVEQVLPKDERDIYEASLIGNNINSQPCVISGYPVIRNKVEFKEVGKEAISSEWNKYLTQTKISHSPACQDVLRFIGQWCGGTPGPQYSFN